MSQVLVHVRAAQLRRPAPDSIVYHRLDCRFVRRLPTVEVNVEVARTAGWHPCARCKP